MRYWTPILLSFVLMSGSIQASDWTIAVNTKEITAITTDKDGKERRTTIWIAVLGEEAYVRTSGTPWERNILRDPQFALEIADQHIPVESMRLQNQRILHSVQERFHQKYGFADYLAKGVRVLLGGGSHIYRVRPR